jgi:hypothetical protein
MAWDAPDQIDPFALLEREAEKFNCGFRCWENGLVDYWDDEPAVHAVAAVKYGMRDHLRRRRERPGRRPFAFRLSDPEVLDSATPGRLGKKGFSETAVHQEIWVARGRSHRLLEAWGDFRDR